ncbi:MAG: DoxX family membrane protein [Gammaproteobacteria bacterium]|nr:DoxX family membrane protein [Gammaproteobacteria bacterium]
MNNVVNLVGRILLAQIFIIAGVGKIFGYAGTAAYMAAMGVPGALLPLVIALEIGGGLLLIIGWKTKWVAFALAAFCIVAGLIFHHNFADMTQRIMFMKNLAIAGGFLILAMSGPGALSVDKK